MQRRLALSATSFHLALLQSSEPFLAELTFRPRSLDVDYTTVPFEMTSERCTNEMGAWTSFVDVEKNISLVVVRYIHELVLVCVLNLPQRVSYRTWLVALCNET